MDWAAIKRNFRVQSGRSRRVNEQIAADRDRRRLLAQRSGWEARSEDLVEQLREETKLPVRKPKKSTKTKSQAKKNVMTEQTPQEHAVENDEQIEQQDSSSDTDDFDLAPPPRARSTQQTEYYADLLLSDGHLETLLHDPELCLRLTTFLQRYKPHYSQELGKYIETQKALKAVEYANAVAAGISVDGEDTAAAHVYTSFQDLSAKAFEVLLEEALPAYISYNLVKVTSEIMVNEITGRRTPIMNGLVRPHSPLSQIVYAHPKQVSGLSEVFCLTDPHQQDNPIIYASQEFFNMTGYSRDFVLGNNCRFLQGPKSKKHSINRLRDANANGEELSETILNYTRDGRPFMNLLMIAPLHDSKGRVKYYIGAQLDVSKLVEGGKGLDSLRRHIELEETRGRRDVSESGPKQKALEKLGELSELFDLDESGVIARRSRSTSSSRSDDKGGRQRRILNDTSTSESEEDDSANNKSWSLAQSSTSGRLPGVYRSYFLMRPAPSYKIIFVSPALQKMGKLVQTNLLSHITAPKATLQGLKESFESGTPVTAKVLFSASASTDVEGKELNGNHKDLEDAASKQTGRTTWLSATPLVGSDEKVGVWMVVVVEGKSLGSGSRGAERVESVRSEGSSTLKGDGSAPDLTRLKSKSDKPDYIEMPSQALQHKENEAALNNGDQENGLLEEEADIGAAAFPEAEAEAESIPLETVPFGASAATPDPSVHPYSDTNPLDSIQPADNASAVLSEQTVTNDHSTPTITTAKRHIKRQSLPQSHADFAPGKPIVLETPAPFMDYLINPAVAGKDLTIGSLGFAELERSGGTVTGSTRDEDGVGDESPRDRSEDEVRTPFSVD